MTQLEYKKMRMERRRKSCELFDRAKAADLMYPPDLYYLWDFMQEKNIGLPHCLGMIYNLGFIDGMEKGAVTNE